MSFSSILKSKIFTIAAVLLVGWFSLSAIQIRSQTQNLSQKNDDLSNKAANIEFDNERLAREIDHGRDPLFLEKEAKAKLNLKLADENVVFIYATKAPVQASVSGESIINFKEASNVKKWLYWLLGY